MKQTYSSRMVGATVLSAVVAFLFVSSQASAQAPTLGSAASFSVLGGSAVTNTGSTVITGNLGVSPNTAISGFPPGTVTGTTHQNDAVAQQAQKDVQVAYDGLAGLPCNTVLTGQDLGGRTLVAGVYCFSTSAQLTGTLILDAQGNPNAQFIFQIGTTLTTASNSVVRVINGGQNCNVYWQVGSSATLGTATSFAGNILALAAITATTGSNVSGRLLARVEAVTLDSNRVSGCAVACPAITLSPTTLPIGTLGAAYSQTITASGGTPAYTYEILSGTPPPGLTLSNTGVLSGTPTTAGSFTFTVRAADAAGCFGSRVYTMDINAAGCPAITLAPLTMPAATVGTPYASGTITASPGPGPYTFTPTSGPLPPGLTVSTTSLTTFVISGTPTQSGSFTFTITGAAAGCRGSQIYTILVNCPVVVLAPATLSNGVAGAPYGPVTFTASGGRAPYNFILASGSLPTGLTLSPGGTLSGTTTTSGNFQFTIAVTDSAGCAGARTFTMAVAVPPAGGATLDSVGLTILVLLLAAAGVFAVNRFTM